ncbi:hypothetical protein HPB50_002242 [Hyalomma asiaticum]|uniref:Uncharacterized protein n=1 Tax=Hyalomma asiaticum TaxID=266040 RepID=A0ACB7TBH2_HYAAI|nr:hypothetical protein HPB50_002242 [Hyalomma asiaticum]
MIHEHDGLPQYDETSGRRIPPHATLKWAADTSKTRTWGCAGAVPGATCRQFLMSALPISIRNQRRREILQASTIDDAAIAASRISGGDVPVLFHGHINGDHLA